MIRRWYLKYLNNDIVDYNVLYSKEEEEELKKEKIKRKKKNFNKKRIEDRR